ncbi:hypothetical protein Q5P01_010644 [Channa striata]|uniref:Uncharacterized protein n=1 Tax=Channa striata TaxID=64152 RepID=A0AA88SM26_CHASR|nr:hypothetical protein Q5P01_010644 [Channa striata]
MEIERSNRQNRSKLTICQKVTGSESTGTEGPGAVDNTLQSYGDNLILQGHSQRRMASPRQWATALTFIQLMTVRFRSR